MAKQIVIFEKKLDLSDERLFDISIHHELIRIATEAADDVKNILNKHKTLDELMKNEEAFRLMFALEYMKFNEFLEKNNINDFAASDIYGNRKRNYFTEEFDKLVKEYERIYIYEMKDKDVKLRTLYKNIMKNQILERAAFMDIYDSIDVIQFFLLLKDCISLEDEEDAEKIFNYLKENKLNKGQAYEVAYQLFCKNPLEQRYYEYCLINFPEQFEGLITLLNTVGQEISKDIIEQSLEQYFIRNPHSTEEEMIEMKQTLLNMQQIAGIEQSKTVNKVINALEKLDIQARTFNGILFESRDLRRKAESDFAEFTVLCGDIESLNEQECNRLIETIKEKEGVTEIVQFFIDHLEEKIATIWKNEDSRTLQEIYTKTDIYNNVSIEQSIKEIELIGRTDDKLRYIEALKSIDANHIKLFQKYEKKRNRKINWVYFLSIALSLLGLMLSPGIVIGGVLISICEFINNRKKKKLWNKLTLDGTIFHHQLLKENETKAIHKEGVDGQIRVDKKVKKRHGIRNFIIVTTILGVIIGIFSKEGEEEIEINGNRDIILKLENIADIKIDDDIYTFEYTGTLGNNSLRGWQLCYTEVNTFVKFVDDFSEKFFLEYFNVDENAFSYMGYDIDENQIRYYVDIETSDGSLSIINYDIKFDKFEIMINGERYSVSDEFDEDLRENGIVLLIQENLSKFENIIGQNQLTLDDLEAIQYEDIVAYYGTMIVNE